MARPSKYTPELVKRITQYIADGLTIQDVCYGANISADTFCRWRKEKPEFDAAIVKATEAQTWSSAALAQTSEYRRYIRRQKHKQNTTKNKPEGANTGLEHNNALLGLLRASQSHFDNGKQVAQTSPFGDTLPERSGPPVNEFGELIRCDPYLNTTNGRIEWVEKEMYGKYILHRCSVGNWSER